MPRLLNTWTGEFVWIVDPSKEHYAILSHTWDAKEQTYDDVRKLQETVEVLTKDVETKPASLVSSSSDVSSAKLTIFDHPDLSDKVKGICEFARKEGYTLVWIDACCIDKSNSAELSEAINSMYEWYRLADVCYVYLTDVHDGVDPAHSNSSFRRSRWHTRGWTLQELIAPEHVVFLTRNWHFLGTRVGLASTLREITGIDFNVLTGVAGLDDISVARRMSWAARRKTTRVEDRAYSLLGIFGVHISPIYGEGGNAFLRLQEEIIRTIPDQSIFAWGPSRGRECTSQWWVEPGVPCLLASSPSAFEHASDVVHLSAAQFESRVGLAFGKESSWAPPLHCVFTPQGVRINLILISLTDLPEVLEDILDVRQTWAEGCDDCRGLPIAAALALLQCQTKGGSFIALPLCHQDETRASREAYEIAPFTSCTHWLHEAPFRTVHIDGEVLKAAIGIDLSRRTLRDQTPPAPHPMEVLLLRHSRQPLLRKSRQPRSALKLPIDMWASTQHDARVVTSNTTFRIAREDQDGLDALGFQMSDLEHTALPEYGRILLSTSLTTQTCRLGLKQSQRIQIYLTLTHIAQAERSGDLDTTARFSIENWIRPPAPADGTVSLDEVSVAREAPCPDDSQETRIEEFSSRSSSQRTLVEATFIVHDDADWTKSAFGLRRLWLRLQRPGPSPAAAGDPTALVLELSAKLSERFEYQRLA